MLKKIALLLALILLFASIPFTATAENNTKEFTPQAIAMPPVSAASAVLIDAGTNAVLCEKRANERMAPASTTKIMTALVAVENADIERVVTVSPLAVGVEGSSVYLYAGEKITLIDLLYAMLLESANDAAAAIAIEIGGSIDAFSRMMNDKAKALGLSDTHFVNPHGLYDEEHYTTARELALIASAALEHEVLRRIVSTKKHTLLPVEGNTRMLYNHNKMLSLYEGAIGVKTGFTKKSGRTLVSAAERDGLTLIAVTLGAPDDWNDHKKLLDCGFENFSRVSIAKKYGLSYPMAVVGGRSSYVTLTNKEPLSATLPKGTADSLRATFETYTRFEIAPVRSGDDAGYVSYYLGDSLVARSPLIFATDCARVAKKESLFDKIKRIFS